MSSGYATAWRSRALTMLGVASMLVCVGGCSARDMVTAPARPTPSPGRVVVPGDGDPNPEEPPPGADWILVGEAAAGVEMGNYLPQRIRGTGVATLYGDWIGWVSVVGTLTVTGTRSSGPLPISCGALQQCEGTELFEVNCGNGFYQGDVVVTPRVRFAIRNNVGAVRHTSITCGTPPVPIPPADGGGGGGDGGGDMYINEPVVVPIMNWGNPWYVCRYWNTLTSSDGGRTWRLTSSVQESCWYEYHTPQY